MPTASSSDTRRGWTRPPRPLPGCLSGGIPSLDFVKIARIPQLRAALLVALGYYLGAKIGSALTLDPSSVPTLWPPNAILLAGLLLTPVRSWAIVLGAAFAVHLAAQLEGGVPLA